MINTLQNAWNSVLAENPDALVIMDAESGQRFTRADIERRAQQRQSEFALHRLKRQGVLMRLPNGADWIASLLALRRLGAVVIPVDSATSETELARIAKHLRTTALLTTGGFKICDAPVRCWKPCLALIKVTSGSTGAPTAIPFSEAEISADGLNIQATMGITTDDLNYALLPFAHSYALGNLVAPLLHGVPLVLGSAPLPRVIAEEIASSDATIFPSTPTIFEALTRTDDISLGNLRLCITAAAPLTPELAQCFEQKFGQRLHNFYGASECGGIAYDCTGELGVTGESVGTPMSGVTLAHAPDGRLRVSSGAVSRYGRTCHDGSYAKITLGDQVKFSDTGAVKILGRSDRVVKCAGRRIDLNAMEKAAGDISGVTHAVVWFEAERERLHIAIAGGDVALVLANLQERHTALRGRLRVKAVDEIPITARGKVDFRKLATS